MKKKLLYISFISCFLMLNACKSSIEKAPVKSPTVNTDQPPKLPLEYLAFPPKESPTNASTLPPLLILLHGYGSNKADLLNFQQYIDPRFFVISLQAPNDLGNDRYAWYNLDFSTKKLSANEQEAKVSQAKLIEFINDISKTYEINSKHIYLIGFSQGAIMSIGTALSIPQKIAGIGVLSGRFPRYIDRSKIDKTSLKDFPIFVSHGTKDMVIQLEEAHKTRSFFEQQTTAKLAYHEYEMAHTISRDNLKDLLDWLKKNYENP